jgi:hypothetical protein
VFSQKKCSWRTKAKRLLPLDDSRCAQYILLRAPLSDDLDANRKSCRGKTDRYRHRGLARHIPGKRIGTPSPIVIGKSLRDIAFGGPRPGGNDWTYKKVETIEECPRRGGQLQSLLHRLVIGGDAHLPTSNRSS